MRTANIVALAPQGQQDPGHKGTFSTVFYIFEAAKLQVAIQMQKMTNVLHFFYQDPPDQPYKQLITAKLNNMTSMLDSEVSWTSYPLCGLYS